MEPNKTFIIAGAGSGIGLEICKLLVAKGNHVIALGRSQKNLLQIENVTFYQHDFSTDDPLPEFETALDGLIYCPGTITLKPFNSLKEQNILDDFLINVVGAFKMIRCYRTNLIQSPNSSILLFSSVAAQTGMPFHVSIGISKSGVEGMTKSLAAEFAPKIRVNCIAPSLTDTPLASNLLNSDTKRTANAERHPLKRIGNAEEVASLAVFILNDASWMTGQTIGINGGLGTVFK